MDTEAVDRELGVDGPGVPEPAPRPVTQEEIDALLAEDDE